MEPEQTGGVSIYAPPKAEVVGANATTTAERDGWKRAAYRSGVMFVAAWGAICVAVLAISLNWQRGAMCAFGAATALFAFSVNRAHDTLRRLFGLGVRPPIGATLLVCIVPLIGGFLMTLASALATLVSTFGFRRGRQVRRFGRPVLAPTVVSSDARTERTVAVPEELRIAIAAQWRVNAQTEHASVAAFANLTLALVALGAPEKLVEAAQRDGVDETRHARMCFALASAIDGETHAPGPFPHAARSPRRFGGRTWTLAGLAIESVVDGALHEGVSARSMAQLARVCEEPSVKELLRVLAADEARHAMHGWEVVKWCVAEGGAPVIAALSGALAALPDRLNEGLPAAAIDGSWQRFGIPGAALIQEEYAVVKQRLSARVMTLVRLQ